MRLPVLAALAAVTLALAGCGSDAPTSSEMPMSGQMPGNTEDAGSTSDHNDADVSFAQDMIPHHQQALLMSDMALQAASTDELSALAQRIKDAQAPEIEQMTGWLESWDETVPDLEALSHMMMGHGDDDDANDMPGMMDVGQMRRMNEMMVGGGLAFDQMWVRMMIEHHEGAIEMAQEQQADGEYPEAIALAESIEKSQTAEIAEMEQMLDDWADQG